MGASLRTYSLTCPVIEAAATSSGLPTARVKDDFVNYCQIPSVEIKWFPYFSPTLVLLQFLSLDSIVVLGLQTCSVYVFK